MPLGISVTASLMHRLRRLARDEAGFSLVLALIVITVSFLVVAPVVALRGTVELSRARIQDQGDAYYAAEAGMERIAADLVRGADALSSAYTIPSITVKGLSPSVSIANPGAVPIATPVPVIQYFDPGVRHPHLAQVAPQKGYLVVFENVYTGTLQVNWSYSPASTTRLGIWDVDLQQQGETPGQIESFPTQIQPILDTVRAARNVSFIRSSEVPVGQGVHSIVFFNASPNITVTTTSFLSGAGPLANTWVRATAFKDYFLTSQVEGVTTQAYLRQIPGPSRPPTGAWSQSNISWISNTLTVHTWLRP